MRSKGQQQQSTRRIRRERRRLGRFVAFSEMLTDAHSEAADRTQYEGGENKAAAGALMKVRGQLVLEIACWFALFALIGIIAYQR